MSGYVEELALERAAVVELRRRLEAAWITPAVPASTVRDLTLELEDAKARVAELELEEGR
jgi:hypothetical protein